MTRYLLLATYSPAGAAGVNSQGMVSRRTSVTAGVEAIGGAVVSMDVVLGGSWDFAIITDMPSAAAAKAMLMTTHASGGFEAVAVHELVPVEDFDSARTADYGAYRPPNA